VTVEKTPHGTWKVRWREHGRQRALTFKRKTDATNHDRIVNGAIAAGTHITTLAGDITVTNWATEWLDKARGLGAGGRETYRRDLDRHIIPTLGHAPLRALTPDHIDQLLSNKLDAGYAPSTVHRVYRTLHAMCAFAVQRGRLATNPCGPVEPPKIADHEEMRFLTATELEALADAISPRYRAFILVAGWAGLRWSEMLGLRRRDIVDERITITTQIVRRADKKWHRDAPKTKAGRRTITLPVTVAAELADHLDTYVAADQDASVFTTRRGNHLSGPSWTAHTFKRACVTAGLGHWVNTDGEPVEFTTKGGPLHVADAPRIHDLRHTAVALAIAAGGHPKAIQARMGHASISVTLDRYGHLYGEMDEQIALNLDRLRRPTAETVRR
jgi:integrase